MSTNLNEDCSVKDVILLWNIEPYTNSKVILDFLKDDFQYITHAIECSSFCRLRKNEVSRQ